MMTQTNDNVEALIKFEGVQKVFYTEELETHALSDVNLEVRKGEYLAIAALHYYTDPLVIEFINQE